MATKTALQDRVQYGQFVTARTTGPRTIALAGSGRTGLGPTAINLTWATPAAARTITIPDPGGDDTLVTLAATQTLTNKTFTAPTFGGVTTIAAGTAAAPSLTFTGDTDTGVYRVAANDFGVAVGGLIGFDVLGVASAVNNLKVTNSATLSPVLIDPIGTDTNIGITVTTKGTGVLTLTGGTGSSVVVGRAGTAARAGVRNGASRQIDSNRPTAPVDIAGGITATVTQMLEAGIFLCSASATLTLPDMAGASGLVQALPGTPAVGDIVSFVQVVAAGQTATLAAGNGSTLGGIATTAAATTGRRWIGRITAVTAGSETVTWY